MEKKCTVVKRTLKDNREILEKLIEAQKILGECYSDIAITEEEFSEYNKDIMGRITEINGYIAKLGYEISHDFRELYKLVEVNKCSDLFKTFIELVNEIRTFIACKNSLADTAINVKVKNDINCLIDSLRKEFNESVNDESIVKAIDAILPSAIQNMDFTFFPMSEYYADIANTLKNNGFRVESARVIGYDPEGYVVYLKENSYYA